MTTKALAHVTAKIKKISQTSSSQLRQRQQQAWTSPGNEARRALQLQKPAVIVPVLCLCLFWFPRAQVHWFHCLHLWCQFTCNKATSSAFMQDMCCKNNWKVEANYSFGTESQIFHQNSSLPWEKQETPTVCTKLEDQKEEHSRAPNVNWSHKPWWIFSVWVRQTSFHSHKVPNTY